MQQMKRVVLFGGSLFIAGLDASLSAIPGLEIQHVVGREEKDLLQVCKKAPNVIIVEMGFTSGNLTLTLLQKFPRATLIALDPESDRLLILTVKREIVLAAAELEKVIKASPPSEEE